MTCFFGVGFRTTPVLSNVFGLSKLHFGGKALALEQIVACTRLSAFQTGLACARNFRFFASKPMAVR